MSSLYADYQADNAEQSFNENLIYWRERDDVVGYLEDIFTALEVVPGITFKGITVNKDESKVPTDLVYNDIEMSRLDLAQIYFHIDMQDTQQDITLSIFLPKLIDRLFYQLNGSLYFPILQLVDRGTYITKKTFTLKTLLMPLVFRRDTFARITDTVTGSTSNELVFTLDLFRNKINVFRYFFANRGMAATLAFFGIEPEMMHLVGRDNIKDVDTTQYALFEIAGTSGFNIAASYEWIAQNPYHHGSMIATMQNALDGIQRKLIEEDDITQWKKRLGRHFTQNSNGYEEKADKILISLERILDKRTKKNLAHVAAADKADVYCILRWMICNYRELIQIDGMDVRNKRIRMSEYLIHPLLLKFSESTYRMLNSKNLTFRGLLGMFKPFIHEEDETKARPQTNFLIRKLVSNELLRYSNMVNSFDLITALRWTTRGPQSMADRGSADISLKYRGHHPSYIGRIGLSAASAGDPGASGTLVPFAKTQGPFFL
jgi:hypothetical protein